MSIGSRDYIGSASFLASARTAGVDRDSRSQQVNAADAGPVLSSEDLLEGIYHFEVATPQKLAGHFKVDKEMVEKHLGHLESLELVIRGGQSNKRTYSLSELGLRAREYGRIAKTGG